MDNTQNYAPSVPVQFRHMVPAQPSHLFNPVPPQHFQPPGQGVSTMNVGLPPQAQLVPVSQPMQQFPARPGQPERGLPPPQAVPIPSTHTHRPFLSGSPIPQHSSVQTPDNYAPGQSGFGATGSSSFTYASTSYPRPAVNFSMTPQYQPISQTLAPSPQILVPPPQLLAPQSQTFAPAPQMLAQPCQATGPSAQGQPSAPVAGIPSSSSESQSSISAMNVQQNADQSAATTAHTPAKIAPSNSSEKVSTDWIEHVNSEGKRYYYNKKTRQSTWEKPFDLMTPIERADSTTDWREFTSPDGRKYYYNKVTKQSTWTIPMELKLAREHKGKETPERTSTSEVTPVVNAGNAESVISAATLSQVVAASPQPTTISETSVAAVPNSSVTVKADDYQTVSTTVAGDAGGAAKTVDSSTEPVNNSSNSAPNIANDTGAKDVEKGVKAEDPKEADVRVQGEKGVEQQPLVYGNKLEAKNAFKELLESANVGSDWTWDRAMRVIINDKRYGALKSLGERKQAFNEYLSQKKKQEAEDRRIRQKKAREDFRKMLEECKELKSSTRWSKVVAILEEDERFKAVERDRDRKDLYESYIEDLEKKERAKAQEERKKKILEYRKFLKSCDFIKANTQWRKVQDRLETDERCRCLEKIDRLEIFQDYIHELEKEEEERKRIEKEELRKVERKNRDEFRKLLEEHVTTGVITAKTDWRDYSMKVQDMAAFQAVASNTSGSTAKDLFEDVREELQKQYHEDRARIKDAVKLGKIDLSSTWTLEEFKRVIADDIGSPSISDVNLKLVFDELLERARKKEEKEAKRRKHLQDDFFDLLCSIKEITTSSKWDECKHFFDSSREYGSIGDENLCMGIFNEYIGKLKEKAREFEHKRKEEKAKKEKEREERDLRRSKQRREKERGRESEKYEHSKQVRADDNNAVKMHASDESKRSREDSNEHQKQRHHSNKDDLNKKETVHSRSSHRQNSDNKKSKHASTPESDSGRRHKRHRRDHSPRNDKVDLAN